MEANNQEEATLPKSFGILWMLFCAVLIIQYMVFSLYAVVEWGSLVPTAFVLPLFLLVYFRGFEVGCWLEKTFSDM